MPSKKIDGINRRDLFYVEPRFIRTEPWFNGWITTADDGVAVDDERKRDYFVPRLQKIVDEQTWAVHLTFRVVPMDGAAAVDVKKQT